MHHELHTQVDVDATPEAVWSVLIDLDRYAEWNPFIVEAHGTVAVGDKLVNRMQAPGRKAMTIKPTVTAVESAQAFEWLGNLGFPGVFDGRHRFDLEATPTGSARVIHSEQFDGLLVRFMRKTLDTKIKEGFEAMNIALKSRAEAQSGAAS